jgi:predicted extracellular nuclease
MAVTIATFNVENLLNRFDFHTFGQMTRERALDLFAIPFPYTPESLALRQSLTISLADDARQQTAQAVRDTGADIIGVQEIDNKPVLDLFHDRFLKSSTHLHYGWRRTSPGNDPRGIEVGVMSKPRIARLTMHNEITFGDFDLYNSELMQSGESEGDRIFRRDCLELDFNLEGTTLTIFVCHFKSMAGGRLETRPVRHAEAKAVRRIIEDRFGANTATAKWIIVGDLNDYVVSDTGTADPDTALGPLFEGGFSTNVLENLPPLERWTHYFPDENSFHQLDYILLSPALASLNGTAMPVIVRGAQPYRVPGLEAVPRYPRVGFDRPKASDHCPVSVTLNIV